jgi:uncharacterized protein (TIGR02271 family)
MAYEKVVAVYDTIDRAAQAKKALTVAGFHPDDISIVDRSHLSDARGTPTFEPKLWNRLFGGDIHRHEAQVYGDTIKDGGAVLTARVVDTEVAHATGILDLYAPVDVHDRALTTGVAPAARVDAVAERLAAEPLAPAQVVAVTPEVAKIHPEVLRLAQEQLEVGKERVQTGETRVRRYTTVQDVDQDVTLHEEHAEVLRRAINEPMTLTDADWADREIEVVETAEHALVSKTARVVEEVSLRSVGSDHVETVHEKLRRQQADIFRADATGKPLVR